MRIEHCRPYFIYINEFASFTTETIAEMLAKLRKYRFGLVLAGQYLSGVETPIRDANFGNVGNFSVFRVEVTDAPFISRQLGSVDPDSLINLPNYRMFIKIMVKGIQTKAFSAKSIDL